MIQKAKLNITKFPSLCYFNYFKEPVYDFFHRSLTLISYSTAQ